MFVILPFPESSATFVYIILYRAYMQNGISDTHSHKNEREKKHKTSPSFDQDQGPTTPWTSGGLPPVAAHCVRGRTTERFNLESILEARLAGACSGKIIELYLVGWVRGSNYFEKWWKNCAVRGGEGKGGCSRSSFGGFGPLFDWNFSRHIFAADDWQTQFAC